MRLSIILLFLSHLSLNGQAVLSPRIANYDIDLVLNTKDHTIDASQQLKWVNTSNDTIKELQFHLYYNAFKNSESTFMQRREFPNDFGRNNDCFWSFMDVESIVDYEGNELITASKYISPDDQNPNDQTVLSVPLKTQLLPGETAIYDMEWNSRIPNIMPRTGYNKSFYFFAQWFPKVGVYEAAGVRYAKEGQWSCHQYHSSGEYYSDFGNYKVKITVPSDYIVGASGVQKHEEIGEGTKTVVYEVEDVIDFAWAASPEFQIYHDKWNDVDIKLLSYSTSQSCKDRYFKSAKNVIQFLHDKVGPYPYPSLTIIDPPIHGIFTGGMEYPTLITSLNFCFLPTGLKTTEVLTTHEFIHQYFMQMIANHEQDEPWMDEGITSYYEGRILDHFEGTKTSLVDVMGVKIGNSEFNRGQFFGSKNTKIAPNSYKSREYVHGGYGDIAYNKAAIWLKTLEGIIGIETFDGAMRAYFEKWKFKHPCATDFTDHFSEFVTAKHGNKYGENLDWYFDQVLYGTVECDYTLHSIKNEKITAHSGFYDDLDQCESKDPDEKLTKSTVSVRREGEMLLPVEVQVYFEDGSIKNEQWDGLERAISFEYLGESKVISATIDPEQKIWIDKNLINNSKTLKKSKLGLKHFFSHLVVSLQNIFQTMSFFS